MLSLKPDTLIKAYLMLTFTTMCWGANAVFSKLAVGEIPPMLLVSTRWLGALMLMLIFASSHIKKDWPIIRERLVYAFVLGMMGFTGFNVLFYSAAYSTTALNIGIIQGSIPVFVLIGSFLLFRTRVASLQYVGVALTILGVITVGTRGELLQLTSIIFNSGDIMMVMACSLYGAYTVGLRKRPDVSALGLFTVLAGAAFVVSLPFSILEFALDKAYWPTPFGWFIVAMITVFPSFLAQIFFIQSVEKLGPNRAGVFINLVPVFASVFAVIILSEPFEIYHGVALALVFGGIWFSERGKGKP